MILDTIKSCCVAACCAVVACSAKGAAPETSAEAGHGGGTGGSLGGATSFAGASSVGGGIPGGGAGGTSGAPSSGGTGATGTGGSSGPQGGQAGQGGSLPADCGPALPPPPASGTGPNLTVDVCAQRHPISPGIYGVTFFFGGGATQATNLQFAKDVRLPLNRLGGDATTRYNWQVDSSNSGFDWFFIGGSGNATATPGASIDALVTTNKTFGAQTIVTIPIIDFINKGSAYSCSYPKSLYPNQQSFNAFIHPNGDDCGNGNDLAGKPIADSDPTRHDIANTPAIQKAWVQHLVGKFGAASAGGVPIYQMDNEPSGWQGIHFDVHPKQPSCSELRDKILAYAAAVKEADPSAAVLAPGDIAPADEFSCDGGMTLGQYLLTALADYEKQHGVRLVDYYSNHYPGCCSGDPVDTAEKRIAKHKGWIADKYPGTKLGFDEYNWGTDIGAYASALNVADGLGLFGREGVDVASFWGLDDSSVGTGTAFRLYRNYDGKGSAFGDSSIAAASSDKSKLRVYAAERVSDHAVTVVVVNKTSAAVSGTLVLSNHHSSVAHVYQLTSANASAVVASPDLTVADPAHIVSSYPPQSATLLVFP